MNISIDFLDAGLEVWWVQTMRSQHMAMVDILRSLLHAVRKILRSDVLLSIKCDSVAVPNTPRGETARMQLWSLSVLFSAPFWL